jgi:hypothetical protein
VKGAIFARVLSLLQGQKWFFNMRLVTLPVYQPHSTPGTNTSGRFGQWLTPQDVWTGVKASTPFAAFYGFWKLMM